MSCWVLVSGKGWRNSAEELGICKKKKKTTTGKTKIQVNFFFVRTSLMKSKRNNQPQGSPQWPENYINL